MKPSRLLPFLLAACAPQDAWQSPPPQAGDFMPALLDHGAATPSSLEQVDSDGLTVCGVGRGNIVLVLAGTSEAATPEVCNNRVGGLCSQLSAPVQVRGQAEASPSAPCTVVMPSVDLASTYPNGACLEAIAVQGIGGRRSVVTPALCLPAAAPQPVCGDGVVEGAEACDDGNTFINDGCDDQCQIETRPTTCTATGRVVITPLTAGDLASIVYDVSVPLNDSAAVSLPIRLHPIITSGFGAGSVSFDKFVTLSIPANSPNPFLDQQQSIGLFVGTDGPPVVSGVECTVR